jgi:hypothetical protein
MCPIEHYLFMSHFAPMIRTLNCAQNSCPLCQDQGVATEIRYYETIDDGDSDDAESRGSGWRRKMRRMFLNVATGGHAPSYNDQIRT